MTGFWNKKNKTSGRKRAASLLLSAMLLFAAAGAALLPADVVSAAPRSQNYTLRKGVDISKWQNIKSVNGTSTFTNNIDFNAMKATGVEFVIIQCGGRTRTADEYGGLFYEDDAYRRNIEGALAAGLKVGVYYWCSSLTVEEAAGDVEWCAQLIAPYNVTLPVFYDYEWSDRMKPGPGEPNAESKALRTAVIDTFCSGMEAKGYPSGVYMNMSTSNHVDAKYLTEKHLFWIARYTNVAPVVQQDGSTKNDQVPMLFYDVPPACNYTGVYDFWQYSSRGTDIGGVHSTYVDLDYWYDDGSISEGDVEVFRMYNPNSGEHFYTTSAGERDALKAAGWNYEEGAGWISPKMSSTPVYRLYNKKGGEHFYTADLNEKNSLVKAGWKFEGISFYSDDNHAVPLHRQYNPNKRANNHNYTPHIAENDYLVSIGWKAEGIALYAKALQQ